MRPAQRNGELVAHLAAQRAVLHETQTRLPRDEPPMVFVPNPTRFWKVLLSMLSTDFLD